MKKLNTLFVALGLFFCAQAQTNTGILEIKLDINQLSGTCKLAGVDTVYIHSGLGWSNPDSVWQSIVGGWGRDNGIGRMTNEGNGVHSICFRVVDYYTDYATKDSTSPNGEGYGPMPAGETPYNIGAVFRTATCPISLTTGRPECDASKTGKDPNCQNVYILGINNPSTMVIVDNAGNEFPAMTAQYITDCAGISNGINDNNPSFKGISIYPVPFTDKLHVDFNLLNGNLPKIEILDLLGNKVASPDFQVSLGMNSFIWNGKNFKGDQLPGGVYLIQISNGDQTYTGKIIKQ